MSELIATKFNSKGLVLLSYIEEGLPASENFEIRSQEVDIDAIDEGDLVLEVQAMSADPYLRGAMKSTGSFVPGQFCSGFVAGRVIASKNPSYKVDDLMGASLPFVTVQKVTAAQLARTVHWKLTGLIEPSEISLGVGILGMPGSTAYGGLIDVLRPNSGETIFISAASGAVGSLVGMLAKQLYGCKVVGSCGGPEKCELIKEKFGFDHAIDYKTLSNATELAAAIKAVAPEGIDMYFENVGGMHFEAAMECLRPGGRVAICGQIAEYNSARPQLCAFQPMKMIYTAQRIEGFVCFPWLSGKKGNFLSEMHGWLREGKVVPQECFFDGIEEWPVAFRALFTGSNLGKVVVRV